MQDEFSISTESDLWCRGEDDQAFMLDHDGRDGLSGPSAESFDWGTIMNVESLGFEFDIDRLR
jgi:hypothetical protein